VETSTLLKVKGLKKYFPIHSGIFFKTTKYVRAVNGVSFSIQKRDIFGLVGESGCGKTTTGRLILGLLNPTAGEVEFEGINIFKLSKKKMRVARRNMQIIFQDPHSSLNPRMTIGNIIGDGLAINNIVKGREKEERVCNLLETVGLEARYYNRYPHEFSGGQRQRIGIARALALNPKLVVCDEPVSALDVSIQAQIINLLEDLQEKFGLTYIFVAHDLSVIKHISNRVAVMYLGKIVELTDTEELFSNPLHPYTVALMSAVPILDPSLKRKRIVLEGDVPSPINPPSGCYFRTRCKSAKPFCSEKDPPLVETSEKHFVACFARI
jgi:oligopeptide transport system ATP-binding protein